MPSNTLNNNVNTQMQTLQTASNFQFSAVGVNQLANIASEFTIATIVCDSSGSVVKWKDELERCLKVIHASCKKNPHADNVLLRATQFSDNLSEIFGFRPLNDVKESDFDGCVHIGGCTSLFRSTLEAIEATQSMAEVLDNQEYTCNGVVYVLTDGEDNASRGISPQDIKKALDDVRRKEKLISLAIILVGLGYDEGTTVAYLDRFKKDAEINQFVDLTDLFKKNSPQQALAKLAGWVSRSISATSKALVTGNSTASSSLLTF